MGTLIQSLSAEFNAEIKTRQDALDVTQAHLRAATRELAEQRKQIQLWQARCSEADQLEHQLRNLDKAVAEEDAFEWTGRADLDARDARLTAPHAFRWSEYAGSVPSEPTYPPPLDPSVGDEADIPLPQGNGVETLVRLRRLKIWSARMESLLEERARRLQGADLLKEFQCRKIVALCTGQPVDKVEQVSGSRCMCFFQGRTLLQLLDDLVKSVENEQTIVDLSRVQGFMQKVQLACDISSAQLTAWLRSATELSKLSLYCLFSFRSSTWRLSSKVCSLSV
jgi:regulatory protein SWI6